VTADGGSPAGRAVEGTFHGLPTVMVAGEAAWFEVLADTGPRIVRLGLAGGPNLLAETPEIAWPTEHGPYRLYGGHRLWLAPEAAGRNTAPDGDGMAVARLADGVRLTARPDLETGCVRTIEVRLDPRRAVLRVDHEVCNGGPSPVELAPWAITQLPPGGTALLPQATAAPGHRMRPNRLVALWPYSSWDDPRLVLHDGFVAVHGDEGPDLKVGCADHAGWAAWVHDGVALVRRWTAQPGAVYPDLGCSAEVYAAQRFTELEVLGPIVTLAPGERSAHTETWELRAEASTDLHVLRDTLAQPVADTLVPAPAPLA
jgi:hypothetical protein